MMSKIATFALMVVMLTSCAAPRLIERGSDRSDSIRVEVRERVEYRDSVVFIEVPREVEKVVTRDTVSTIDNKAAISVAIVSGGQLSHSLEIKPQKVEKAVKIPIHWRDSIAEHYNKHHEVQVIEVKRPLTWWQKTQMRGFWLLLALLAFIAHRRFS